MSPLVSSLSFNRQVTESCTVKQEKFATGKFREFAGHAFSRQENFANFRKAEVLSFQTVASD